MQVNRVGAPDRLHQSPLQVRRPAPVPRGDDREVAQGHAVALDRGPGGDVQHGGAVVVGGEDRDLVPAPGNGPCHFEACFGRATIAVRERPDDVKYVHRHRGSSRPALPGARAGGQTAGGGTEPSWRVSPVFILIVTLFAESDRSSAGGRASDLLVFRFVRRRTSRWRQQGAKHKAFPVANSTLPVQHPRRRHARCRPPLHPSPARKMVPARELFRTMTKTAAPAGAIAPAPPSRARRVTLRRLDPRQPSLGASDAG